MISAVIFDMDGLLLDSEPVWRQAEIRIFSKYGVPITEANCAETMGLRLDEVVSYWHARHPWADYCRESVVEEILCEMECLLREVDEPLPGVRDTISFVQGKPVRLGLATSSYDRLINVVLPTLSLSDTFDAVCSAEHEERGKPHPDVFLTAARTLGVAPEHCLVFEDSPKGVSAARAAGMKCIAVPEPENHTHPDIHTADAVLSSLEDFGEPVWRAFCVC